MTMKTPTLCLALAITFPLTAAGQTFPELSANTPAGEGRVEACEIDGVDGGTRCGRFRVYEDREAQSGRTIDLAFVILDATGPDGATSDVVMGLPGGPGQAMTGGARAFARRDAAIRETRDILLADVRGVGFSQSLDCPEFEIDVEDRFGNVFPPEHIRMCRDALAERANLGLYTTPLSVDDLEDLRIWLGYDAVNLTGASYGTRVGQVYMRRHPEAVRTAILNSVAPVFVLGYVEMARSLQRSLDMVVQDCEADTSCSTGYPGLRGQLDDVLDRLSGGPVDVEVEGETIGFTKGDFSYALRGLLYGSANSVPEVIKRTAAGDFSDLAEYYLQRAGWVGSPGGEAGYHFSALCPEDVLPLTDALVAESSEGTFMGDHLIAGYREVCRIWGVEPLPESFWEPVKSDIPVLVISGELDPVTPPAWGDAIAEHLTNSIHVVVPGGGHGPGNACTQRMQATLVEEASIANLDPSCMN
jgi:pimeloyl-ACP methyl ester carboxylesterase